MKKHEKILKAMLEEIKSLSMVRGPKSKIYNAWASIVTIDKILEELGYYRYKANSWLEIREHGTHNTVVKL